MEITGYYRYALVQLQDYDLWLWLFGQGSFYVLQEKLTYYRRFNEEKGNLSYMDNAREIRAWHENQWMAYTCVRNMPGELFRAAFRGEMKNPKACSGKEIQCEKAFLLWDIQNCFAVEWFIELLEDAECRDILERKYQFTLQDFYKRNMEPMFFDISMLGLIRQQQSVIEDYKRQLQRRVNDDK